MQFTKEFCPFMTWVLSQVWTDNKHKLLLPINIINATFVIVSDIYAFYASQWVSTLVWNVVVNPTGCIRDYISFRWVVRNVRNLIQWNFKEKGHGFCQKSKLPPLLFVFPQNVKVHSTTQKSAPEFYHFCWLKT